jgi:hypothetical protein
MTNYPGALDPLEACENEAVQVIETTLGVNPHGTDATVSARLQRLDGQLLKERTFRMDAYPTPQAAIDAAFAAGGGFVVVPWGVTTLPAFNPVTGCFLMLKPDVSIIGFGAQSVLKVPDGAGNYKAILHHDLADSIDDVILSDFTLDGNTANNPVTYADGPAWVADLKPRVGILLYKAKRTTITGVQTRDLDCINTIIVNGVAVEDCAVVGCHFDTPLSVIDHDHSTIYTNGTACRVQHNHLVGHGIGARTAIEIHGSAQLISGNIERGYDQFGCIVVASDARVTADNIFSKPVAAGWGSTLTGLKVA